MPKEKINKEYFSSRLRAAMDFNFIDRKILAEYCGVSTTTVSHWTSKNNHSRIKPEHLQKISEFFKLPVEYFTLPEFKNDPFFMKSSINYKVMGELSEQYKILRQFWEIYVYYYNESEPRAIPRSLS